MGTPSAVKSTDELRDNRIRFASSLALLGVAIVALVAGVTSALAQAPAAPVDGAEVFANVCAGCHGAEGQGGFGPALTENPDIGDNALVINQILNGGEMMPALAGQLTDDQIVAVVTYIRGAWGNAITTTIEATEVAATRTPAP